MLIRMTTLTTVCYCAYAIAMIIASSYRRAISNKEFFTDGHGRYFRTNGRIVGITMGLSMGLYITVLVLLLHIP